MIVAYLETQSPLSSSIYQESNEEVLWRTPMKSFIEYVDSIKVIAFAFELE